MDRRNAGLALLLGLVAFGAAPRAVVAQQATKVYRIGYLSTPTREAVQRGVEAFLRTLRELGWVEGQNLIIEYRWAEGNVERLPDLAAELVRLKVSDRRAGRVGCVGGKECDEQHSHCDDLSQRSC